MRELRSFASLSSGLLARKGQARPAMRPQGMEVMPSSAPQDDLGWNDMGDDQSPQISAPEPAVARLVPVGDAPQPPAAEPVMPLASEPAPAADIRPVAELTPMPLAQPAQRAAPGTKGKAAFTLRLDPVRHLRLRLACALRHRSAQGLVTEALDAFLISPDLDAMADQAGRATPPFALGSSK